MEGGQGVGKLLAWWWRWRARRRAAAARLRRNVGYENRYYESQY